MVAALLALLGCATAPQGSGPPPTATTITVGFCDKAENTRLVRVGVGGANNTGETETTSIACEENGKPLGCVFHDVPPGTYRVQDGPFSAMVYAGPAPSPAGDARVELTCQGACVHLLTVESNGCGTSGKMRVYTPDPAPVATQIGEYDWAVGSPTKVVKTPCGKLVAEIDDATCGTTVFAWSASAIQTFPKATLTPRTTLQLAVKDAAGKPIPGAYVSDDGLRTTHTDEAGTLTLSRAANAPGSIWVQAAGFGGRLFPVPEPVDGVQPPMSVTLLPTHPVSVSCKQGAAPCSGPVVVVGVGPDYRNCDARSAGDWVCQATDEDSAWARLDTTLTPRVKLAGQEKVVVAF